MPDKPVLIEMDDNAAVQSPADVAAVPDIASISTPTGQAMQTVAALAARKPSRLLRWFWGLALSLLFMVLGVAAYDFAMGLIVRVPVLGYAVTAALALFCMICLVLALKELAGLSRLKRMDGLRHRANVAREDTHVAKAQAVVTELDRLYAGRADISWGRKALAEARADIVDSDTLLGLAERHLMEPLDLAAAREVEIAARQVAVVTAVVPLALADVFAALTSNLRMIRRIAEIYGGRSGALGNWRLARAVMTHLVATGAVAVGDDLISSVAGGGVLSKVSRRFGEGVVNGALTARVGVAAMEVCRPMPFEVMEKPSVTGLVRRALSGMFGGAGAG